MLRKLLLIFTATIFSATIPAVANELRAISAGDILTSDSCFAHIDSNLYVVSDCLPRYIEEVPVGKVAPAGYDVQLCYPELSVLSSKELRLVHDLQKSGVVPADDVLDTDGIILAPSPAPIGGLNLQTNMLLDRKKGVLSVSFCPIVRHEGAWKRILSCQVKVAPRSQRHGAPGLTTSVAESDRWAENSVLAHGKWAKIAVKTEGIYQLTAADINKMGFTDLNKIHIYGYGGLIQNEVFNFTSPNESLLALNAPDDLIEVAVHPTADGRLLFWAEGTVRLNWNTTTRAYTHTNNTYSSYSAYFITENEEPRVTVERLEEFDGSNVTKVSEVPYLAILDNDVMCWYPGGRRFFDEYDFSTGASHSYRLATPGFDMKYTGTKNIEVCVGASSSINSSTFSVKVNNQLLGHISVSTIFPENEVAQTSSSTFNNLSSLSSTEGNVFQLIANNDNKARLDYIRINYPRHLQLSNGIAPYSFSPQSVAPVNLSIEGANATTRLWRIGQQGSPTAEVATYLVNNCLEGVVTTGSRRFVFFDESLTYGVPEFMGEVANQNLHADRDIDYVIIVPANGKLVAQAERLGEIHKKHDGLSYRVVRADQLYNEFSSGTPDANAYRRYLKMLYDRAGDDELAMPNYCLFIGKSVWDNRLITNEYRGQNLDDFLLAFENNNASAIKSVGSVNSYVTDDFFGLLDDGEGANIPIERVDIGLGRFVCANEEEARLLVDKVESYINNNDPGSWKNTCVFLADCGDKNGHMNDSERVVSVVEDIAPKLDIQKVYWDRYTWTSSTTGYTFPQANARIRQLMKDGALLFNYSGHGSPNLISHYKILQTSDFAEAYSHHMSVWVLASCEIYPFDSGENNLAETSLYVPNGGSIAFICATRAVYADRNNLFNKAFCRYALGRNEDGKTYTLGEALRRAKCSLIDSNSDATINKLKYICFGDPALRISLPTGHVVLDSINGTPLKDIKGLATLSAGGIVRFSGHVCRPGTNDVDTSFDGDVSATIFDCAEEITCKYNIKDSDPVPPMVYTERGKSIFKGSSKASEGKFDFIVCIPRDISYSNKAGRISFYAVSNDKTSEYNGFSESFCLNGTAEMSEPDTKGPTVVAYINSIDNPDYTITDENPVLIADISDEYGINNTGISLGHDIELVLDGNEAVITNLNSYFSYDFGSYQRGQLVYEMKGLSRGQHTAQLRVWDVNNNATITTVSFIVRSENAEGGKNGYVTATKNPASTDTRFITYFPADTEVEGLVYFEVYDTRGRCVFKEPVSVSAGSTSSSFTWDLCGNDRRPLPSGVYFYRTVIHSSNGQKAIDAQKLIISRQ